MPVTTTPVLVQTPKITPQNFVEGVDVAGTYKTLHTAGANGSKIVAIIATSNDNAASHIMTLAITRSDINYTLGTVTLAANAGSDGTQFSLDLLAGGTNFNTVGLPKDNDGQKYIFLESGDTLRATYSNALTSGKQLMINTIGANF